MPGNCGNSRGNPNHELGTEKEIPPTCCLAVFKPDA